MWEIYAYWNVSEIYSMLNGVAALMNNAGFFTLLTLGATVGFLGAMISSIAGKGGTPLDIFKFVLIGALFFNLFALPKTTVQILDRTGTTPPMVISNIPVGLAALASITSSVGDWMTTSFETVFSTPDDIKMRNGGGYFAMRIIQEAQASTPYAQLVRYNMTEYVRECLVPDIQGGYKSVDVLRNADDLWMEMAGTNPALLVTLKKWNGALNADEYETVSCTIAYGNITTQLGLAGTEEQKRLAAMLYPHSAQITAEAAFATSLPFAMSYFLGATAKSATEIIKQNVTKNLYYQALTNSATGINAQQALIEAQMAQTAKTTYKTQEAMSGSLVTMRNTIEVLAYAIFPILIIALAIMGHNGMTAIGTYLKVLIWLQLWAPLYAVASYLVALRTKTEITSSLMSGSIQPYSIVADGYVQSGLINALGYSQYILFMIPVIAWMMVSAGASGVASLTSQGAPRSDRIAENAALGNAGNMGNVNYNNTTAGNSTMYQHVQAPNTNIAGPSMMTGPDGSIMKTGAGGTTVDVAGMGNSGSSFTMENLKTAAASTSIEASKLDQQALTLSQSASQTASKAYSRAWDSLYTASTGSSGKSTTGTGEEHAIGTAVSNTQALSKQIADKMGVSEKEAQQAVLNTMAEVGSQGSLKNLKGSGKDAQEAQKGFLNKVGSRIGGLIKGGASFTGNDIDSLSKEVAKSAEAVDAKTSIDDWKKTNSILEKAQKGEDFTTSNGTEHKFSDSEKGEIKQASDYKKGAESARQKAQALRESAQIVESIANSEKFDMLRQIDSGAYLQAEKLLKAGKHSEASQLLSDAIKAHYSKIPGKPITSASISDKVDGVIQGTNLNNQQGQDDAVVGGKRGQYESGVGNQVVGVSQVVTQGQLSTEQKVAEQEGKVKEQADNRAGVVGEATLQGLNTTDKVNKALSDGSLVINPDGSATFKGEKIDPKALGLRQENIRQAAEAATVGSVVSGLLGEVGASGNDKKESEPKTKNQKVASQIGEIVKNIAKSGAVRAAAAAASGPAAAAVTIGGVAYGLQSLGEEVAKNGGIRKTLEANGLISKNASQEEVVQALDGLSRRTAADNAKEREQSAVKPTAAVETKDVETVKVVEKTSNNNSEGSVPDLFNIEKSDGRPANVDYGNHVTRGGRRSSQGSGGNNQSRGGADPEPSTNSNASAPKVN